MSVRALTVMAPDEQSTADGSSIIPTNVSYQSENDLAT
jgi:hypothetical protein